MQTYEAIQTMLAVRNFSSRPIDETTAVRIAEAGRLTGSSRNRQQWNFIVVRSPDTLQKLGSLATTGPYIADAAMAIAVVVPENPTGYIDGARAAQDMMLAAWEEGIGSNWVGNMDQPEVKRLLAVPEELMVLTVLPFGYPTERIGAGKKNRKAFDEVIFAEQYGQTFDR